MTAEIALTLVIVLGAFILFGIDKFSSFDSAENVRYNPLA